MYADLMGVCNHWRIHNLHVTNKHSMRKVKAFFL